MDKHKKEFLDFLYHTKALKLNADFRLKNNRLSPYFINMGELDNPVALRKLGNAYAEKILSLGKPVDVLFGPSYKGIPIAIAAVMSLSERGINAGISFNRKEAKTHGEASDKSAFQKSLIVGRQLRDNDRVIILDDVLTTAETKYEMIHFIKSLAASIEIVAVVIGVDRLEIGINGKYALEEFTQTTGIPVIPVITSADILQYVQQQENLDHSVTKRIETYCRVYGAEPMKATVEKIPPQEIVKQKSSIIPACDVATIEEYEALLQQTARMEIIGGYKLGFELALQYGLPALTSLARKYTDRPLIYDHQKAATDIPDKGKEFARVCKHSGVDTIILFPQAGPETERAWIYHALDQGLHVIVGGIMTHKAYTMSEGGFISDEGALEIYRIAASIGINNFVVPATKLDVIKNVKAIVEAEGVTPIFYPPGFFKQGGNVADVKNICEGRIHAIVGREITEAANKQQAVIEIMKQL